MVLPCPRSETTPAASWSVLVVAHLAGDGHISRVGREEDASVSFDDCLGRIDAGCIDELLHVDSLAGSHLPGHIDLAGGDAERLGRVDAPLHFHGCVGIDLGAAGQNAAELLGVGIAVAVEEVGDCIPASVP